MKYRYFSVLIFAVLFCTLFFPSFVVTADSGKCELTTIERLHFHNKGYVICCGDEEAWEDTVERLKSKFLFLTAFDDSLNHDAPLVMESLDISEVDVHVPGTYNVRIVMKLEDSFAADYYISDENRTVDIPVYISKEEGLEMYLVSDTSYSYKFEWYAPDIFLPREIQYLEAELDARYTEEDLTLASWMVCDDLEIATVTLTTLTVHKPIPQNKAYYFRVKVGDGFTSAVRVTYLDSPVKPEIGGSGGNRDGDDLEEPEVPPLSQTSPGGSDTAAGVRDSTSGGSISKSGQTNPTVAGPSDSLVSNDSTASLGSNAVETVTATKTTISGARIRILLGTEEEFITFAWSGICLRIPKEFFDTLNLADDELFSVEMKRTDRNAFSLSVTSRGRPLTEFASSSVQLSADESELPYTLYLDDEKLDTKVVYQDGCAVFHVTNTGTYRLAAEGHAATSQNKSSSSHTLFFPAAVLFLLICIFGTFIYLRFRRRHILLPDSKS